MTRAISPWLIAAAFGAALPASRSTAQIQLSGSANTWPAPFSIGPGDTDIGNIGLFVGTPGIGTLSVSGGAQLGVGSLSLGDARTGMGSATITGVSTRLYLTGDGFGPGVINRLNVGNWGTGSLVVSGGATLDGRANAVACLGQFHYCHTFIGNASGSDGALTLTGTGTSASLLHGFIVGNAAVFHPPVDAFSFGTPGGTTRGRVEVLDGATLRTERVTLAAAPGGGSPLGTERSFADVVVRGTGSLWLVERPSIDSGNSHFGTAQGPNAWATVRVQDGGRLRMEGVSGFYNDMFLTNGASRTDFSVTGFGSKLEFAGPNMTLAVGNQLGIANLSLTAGGVVEGATYMSVGRDGSRGQLLVDGTGSRLSLSGIGGVGIPDAGIPSRLLVGVRGSGAVTVSGGGRIDLAASGPTLRGPVLTLGEGVGSAGVLDVRGAGSVVSLTAASAVPGGGAVEAFNPYVSVGIDGAGTLNVSGGGKLLVSGHAVSRPDASRGTTFYVGGRSLSLRGGNGVATVTGSGSEIVLAGSDRTFGVGIGQFSTGQVMLSDQGRLASTIALVGAAGGVGVLRIDNARVDLDSQFTGGPVLAGASMVIGDGDGSTGVVSMTNGARIAIGNAGTTAVGISIGGSVVRAGGDGALNLSGGSSITLSGGSDRNSLSVGRTGSGLVRVRGASSIDLGNGNLYVGRFAGADGTMIVSDGSSVSAAYVGVGRNREGDGGTGTLIVNASTLTASAIEIGPNGYLGGNGTIMGSIVNYGIVSPGNSPGTMTVDGSFVNGLGGRLLLEIEGDGSGGFVTDRLIFRAGTTIDLAGLDIRFRFLGATDPNAFQASGLFTIDQFFQGQDLSGGLTHLAPAVFSGVGFGAQADAHVFSSFSFSVTQGATFMAAPVPEPGQWAMLLAGIGMIAAIARKRRPAARRSRVG